MGTDRELREKVAELERQVAQMQAVAPRRGVRKRSVLELWGLPLYDIALGPDPETGAIRGRACGIVAIGDIATGIIALGGVARGVVAIGGVAVGGICLGGLSVGLLLAAGGLAIGSLALGGLALGLVAIGGGAIGMVAIGGGALGYYAMGGAAYGKYVFCSFQRDPEAVQFLRDWIPWLQPLLRQMPG